jgi:hypothetical protein
LTQKSKSKIEAYSGITLQVIPEGDAVEASRAASKKKKEAEEPLYLRRM